MWFQCCRAGWLRGFAVPAQSPNQSLLRGCAHAIQIKKCAELDVHTQGGKKSLGQPSMQNYSPNSLSVDMIPAPAKE